MLFLLDLSVSLPVTLFPLDTRKGRYLKNVSSAGKCELFLVDTLKEHFCMVKNSIVDFSVYYLFELGRWFGILDLILLLC